MKTLIHLLAFTLFASHLTLAAQTLQFSQVILLTNTQTVPAGKVWKISNMLPANPLTSGASGGQSNVSNQTEHKIIVNGVPVFLASSHANYSVDVISMFERGGSTSGTGSRPVAAANASSQTILNGAIWLPAGTTLAPDVGIYGLSILEFNSIP
jgi:hypothetical protein